MITMSLHGRAGSPSASALQSARVDEIRMLLALGQNLCRFVEQQSLLRWVARAISARVPDQLQVASHHGARCVAVRVGVEPKHELPQDEQLQSHASTLQILLRKRSSPVDCCLASSHSLAFLQSRTELP